MDISQTRKERIVEVFLSDPDLTVAAMSRRFGHMIRTIKKILIEAGALIKSENGRYERKMDK